MRPGDKAGKLADFEKELHTKLMEVERAMIGEEMARADVDVGALVVDGATYRRVVRCEEVCSTA